jgi:hypothetical protein
MPVNTENTKMPKKVGRPAKERPGRPVQMRLSDEFLVTVDDWRREQPDLPNRTEAIRRLTALALESEAAKKGKKR